MAATNDQLHISWNEAYKLSRQLAEKIIASCRQSDQQFDAIMVIPRGSYYPVNIVARDLGFGATELLHACISSYTAVGSREPQFTLGQMPTEQDVAGKDLLIIDEVCDTGHTLRFLADYLHKLGANSIKTGVLHYKPEQSQTAFVPDWYVVKTDQWIVYPWEVDEQPPEHAGVLRT